jgi:type II secretory pathway component PulK
MAITRRQKGFALIIVLSLSVVLISIVAEIIFQTEIESRASIGERNRVNAEASAITGAQFTRLLFILDNGIPAEFRPQVEQALGGKQIFQMLDDVPIGGEALATLPDLGKINLNAMLDGALLDGLKAVPGYFVLKTTDENAKLNLNLAIRQDMAGWLYQALKKLFSGQRERTFLEEKGIKPERLAAQIVDYVDPGDRDHAEPGTDEALPYEQAKFTHKPKNAPLESMEEIRRIPGMNDDEVYDLFSPYLTVWPKNPTSAASLNINSAPPELMAALLANESGEVVEEKFDNYEDNRAKKSAEDIKDVSETCQVVTGNTKCPDFISNMAVTKSSTFKVEIQGVSNGIERTLVYVFDRGIKLGTESAKKTPTAAAESPKFKVLYEHFM